jgi:hypothetical protein
LVDHRGDPGAHADHIWVQAESTGDILVDVSVCVDQARQNELSGDVDDLAGARRQYRLFDRRDPTVAHGDVVGSVNP